MVPAGLVLSLLNYGTIGFAAIVLLTGARIVTTEQRRRGQPRRNIVRMFVVLCLFGVALMSGAIWREVTIDDRAKDALTSRVDAAEREKNDLTSRLLTLEAAVDQARRALSEKIRELAVLDARLSSVAGSREQREIELSAIKAERAGLTERLSELEAANVSLGAELKTARERLVQQETELQIMRPVYTSATARYAAEAVVDLGESYHDALTGMSIGIREVSSAHSLYGAVTFPDGETKQISMVPVGTSWNFKWDGRAFVVNVSPMASRKYRVTVREVPPLK